MIYDSIRQAKPAVRNNFGAGRFNTRLNFYFFEINRLSFIQRKNFHNHRFNSLRSTSSAQLNQLDLGFDGWVELLEDKVNFDMKFNSKKTDFKSILSLIPAVYSKDFNTIDTKGKFFLNGRC